MIGRRYLGDSVYVEIEDGMLKLTTENGYRDDPRNVIYLDPEAYAALVRFAGDAQAAASEGQAPPKGEEG